MFKYLDSFSGFSVEDLGKAEKFYKEVLGVKVVKNEMGVLELQISVTTKILVYPKPNHAPATYTVLNFVVDSIDAAVDDLTKKGVQFEHYTGQLQTDEKGIARGKKSGHGPDIAWFKDPAGNILSVIEE